MFRVLREETEIFHGGGLRCVRRTEGRQGREEGGSERGKKTEMDGVREKRKVMENHKRQQKVKDAKNEENGPFRPKGNRARGGMERFLRPL